MCPWPPWPAGQEKSVRVCGGGVDELIQCWRWIFGAVGHLALLLDLATNYSKGVKPYE
jgi:hypothetical protein